jgi:SNF2 family DNA or RNA helicase
VENATPEITQKLLVNAGGWPAMKSRSIPGDSSIPIFLMSLKAGGVGLNLSAADTVIHFDPWWNYAAEAQANRAHRIGQTRVVTAYKLIARDTVEEKIVKLQARKRAASEGTIGSEEPLMSGLTTEDLEDLLN